MNASEAAFLECKTQALAGVGGRLSAPWHASARSAHIARVRLGSVLLYDRTQRFLADVEPLRRLSARETPDPKR